jgi:hypothetical protein
VKYLLFTIVENTINIIIFSIFNEKGYIMNLFKLIFAFSILLLNGCGSPRVQTILKNDTYSDTIYVEVSSDRYKGRFDISLESVCIKNGPTIKFQSLHLNHIIQSPILYSMHEVPPFERNDCKYGMESIQFNEHWRQTVEIINYESGKLDLKFTLLPNKEILLGHESFIEHVPLNWDNVKVFKNKKMILNINPDNVSQYTLKRTSESCGDCGNEDLYLIQVH